MSIPFKQLKPYNFKQMKRNIIALLVVFFVAYNVNAQKNKELSLADIYKNGFYEQKGFGPVRWMKDNKGYSTLENNSEVGGKDIVKYDAKSGKRTVIVPASQLIPDNGKVPLEISDYQWSADDTKLLVFTNTKKVWRYNTRGDYWVLDLKTDTLRQLGKLFPESTLMYAKFSPDGPKVAFVSALNIYGLELKTNEGKQLTKDEEQDTITVTFVWELEE